MSVLERFEIAAAEQTPALRRTLPAPAAHAPERDFSGNDYLGFSRDPQLVHAAVNTARRFGFGATGSRLLSGNTAVHEILERRIARDLGTETALVFPSGYQMNAAVVAALAAHSPGAAVFTDRLIHASLHHGLALAGIHQHRFRHNDPDDLRRRLATAPAAAARMIITETVFGMDGDASDVDELHDIARRNHALLILDDAHGLGVLGERGYGACDNARSRPQPPHTVILGTLSKALGGAGGYVACAAAVRQYLIQKCSGFIYSTALCTALAGAAYAAWHKLAAGKSQRTAILALAAEARLALAGRGYSTLASSTQIVPVLVGDEAEALRLRDDIAAHGYRVSAIRYPTVPRGHARLRLAFCAHHTRAALAGLLEAIDESR